MGGIKEIYALLNYDLTETSEWEIIQVLADLVNAYRHGDGRSADRLYQSNPELFLKAYYGVERLMDQELTTNFEIVFDMDKARFNLYTRAIIYFWEEFPEHLTGIYTFD